MTEYIFDTELKRKAFLFAKNAHESIEQRRKYTDEPYIVHPVAVARIVEHYGLSEEAACAALLHDVCEDTPVTIEEIYAEFGKRIGDLVEMLTDVSKPEDGNRKTRKEIDKQHTAMADYEGKSIKLADMINNAPSIIQNNPGFARKWMKEMEDRMEVLEDSHPELFTKANIIIENYNRKKGK